MRVSPPKVFAVATGAPRPPAEAAGSADAYRQTNFVLGDEVEAILRGLNLEGEAAARAAEPRRRTQRMVSAMGLWSRSWLTRLDGLHAVQWGNYAAAVSLVRAAADYQASMLYLLRTNGEEWDEWLAAGGIAVAADEHATEFRLHAFRAAEVLAAHEALGRIYRVSTDLSLSHFGSTMLLAGSGSAPDHVEMTFGDRDFHMGLAQLLSGWLLELGVALLEALADHPDVFGDEGANDGAVWMATARRIVHGAERCTVAAIEKAGERRYLVSNWRREPRSAPKRLLL